jgi:hypothetical protein
MTVLMCVNGTIELDTREQVCFLNAVAKNKPEMAEPHRQFAVEIVSAAFAKESKSDNVDPLYLQEMIVLGNSLGMTEELSRDYPTLITQNNSMPSFEKELGDAKTRFDEMIVLERKKALLEMKEATEKIVDKMKSNSPANQNNVSPLNKDSMITKLDNIINSVFPQTTTYSPAMA